MPILQPAQGAILLRFRFAEGTGAAGRILLQMNVVGAPGDWRIDTILWEYPGGYR